MMEPRCSIWRGSMIATAASSKRCAARRSRFVGSRATSMNTPETLPGLSRTPKPSSNHDVNAKDRDAVRPLEADPEAWSAPIARASRCPGRICPCWHRSISVGLHRWALGHHPLWPRVSPSVGVAEPASGPVDQSRSSIVEWLTGIHPP